MKYTFLLLGLTLGFACQAQSSSPNLTYNEHADMTSGRFEYKINERETMNVNYSLSPKHPQNAASFSLHTPQAMPFSADIINASGKIVYKWKPENKVYLYNASWDLSKLKAGDYQVRIYMEGNDKSIYQFSFSKQ